MKLSHTLSLSLSLSLSSLSFSRLEIHYNFIYIFRPRKSLSLHPKIDKWPVHSISLLNKTLTSLGNLTLNSQNRIIMYNLLLSNVN